MKRAAPGTAINRFLDLLNEHGPMTRAELCEQLTEEPNYASGILSRLVSTKRVHVVRYDRSELNGRVLYARAVYKAGPGPNAKKPPPLTERELKQRKPERPRIASVFDLAMTRRQWRDKRKSVAARDVA